MESQAGTSKIVTWGGYLALTLLLALPLSVLSVRAGLWQQGLLLYALSSMGAALLLVIFVGCIILPRFSAWRRDLTIRCLAVLPGALLFLSLLMGRGDYPVIHDITTDLVTPPVFTQAPSLRDKSDNSLEIDPETLKLQSSAYPDLKTGYSTRDLKSAFTRATSIAREMGWEITLSDSQAGIIEAVAITRIMAFKDDVVVRIRSTKNGTQLDLRSASRVGQSDLGANAKRIGEFMRRYES